MRTYLVFEPAGGVRNAEGAARIRLVQERFSWPALFFTPLWLLWHRLWLAFAGWLAALIVIAVVVQIAGLEPRALALALLAPSFVIAFEATELRRRKLLRGGMQDAGIAIGADMEEAELRFLTKWAARAGPPPAPKAEPPGMPPAPASTFAPAPQNSVVGLFPEPGGGR